MLNWAQHGSTFPFASRLKRMVVVAAYCWLLHGYCSYRVLTLSLLLFVCWLVGWLVGCCCCCFRSKPNADKKKDEENRLEHPPETVPCIGDSCCIGSTCMNMPGRRRGPRCPVFCVGPKGWTMPGMKKNDKTCV